MPRPAPLLLRGALLLVAVCSVGCNAGPAEEAIDAAEAALEAARPALGPQAPGDLAALERVLADARVAFEEGRYTDALRTAQALPAQAQAAVDAALARSAERARAEDAQEAQEAQEVPPAPPDSTPTPEPLLAPPSEPAPPAPELPAPVGS